jgi:long-chain acyl-CoA synthetase
VGDERPSCQNFARIVDAWVARLERLGVAPGDRVAMLLPNAIAFPAVLFAALKLGAIAVPISIREQTPGLGYMLAHSRAKVLVYDADLAARLPIPAETPQLRHRIGVEADAAWIAPRLQLAQ